MKTLFAKIVAWCISHVTLAFLIAIVLVGGSGLRACYYSGQVEAVLKEHPPMSNKQQKELLRKDAALETRIDTVLAQKDVAEAKAAVHGQLATKLTRELDSLKTKYNEIPAATARATDAELARFLANYTPSAFPDTTAR